MLEECFEMKWVKWNHWTASFKLCLIKSDKFTSTGLEILLFSLLSGRQPAGAGKPHGAACGTEDTRVCWWWYLGLGHHQAACYGPAAAAAACSQVVCKHLYASGEKGTMCMKRIWEAKAIHEEDSGGKRAKLSSSLLRKKTCMGFGWVNRGWKSILQIRAAKGTQRFQRLPK